MDLLAESIVRGSIIRDEERAVHEESARRVRLPRAELVDSVGFAGLDVDIESLVVRRRVDAQTHTRRVIFVLVCRANHHERCRFESEPESIWRREYRADGEVHPWSTDVDGLTERVVGWVIVCCGVPPVRWTTVVVEVASNRR